MCLGMLLCLPGFTHTKLGFPRSRIGVAILVSCASWTRVCGMSGDPSVQGSVVKLLVCLSMSHAHEIGEKTVNPEEVYHRSLFTGWFDDIESCRLKHGASKRNTEGMKISLISSLG